MNNLALFIHKFEENRLLIFDVIDDSYEHFNNQLKIQKSEGEVIIPI
jgi:hypothetical protein